MQNEDKEWRGLEGKLRRLQPREIDESSFKKLLACLDEERDGQSRQGSGGNYPSNVLWVRFAPVAAAAGVVLLGTFFLRYESRMDRLQAQRNDGAMVVNGGAGNSAAGTAVAQTLPETNLTGLGANPVPRLGMNSDVGPHPSDMSLLPVSAQDYLQPVEGLNIPQSALLRYEDAYLLGEGSGDPGTDKEKPKAGTQ